MSKQKTGSKQKPRPTAKRAIKTARGELRMTKANKALVQRAATLKGQSFNEFAETNLVEAAVRVQKDYESMELSRRDAKAFVAAMLADDEPSPRLKAAVQHLKARTEA